MADVPEAAATAFPGQQPRAAQPDRPPDQQILHAAVAFARSLRSYGLHASVDSELVFLRALTEVDLRDRTPGLLGRHATFVHSPDERPVFDSIFERFWEGREMLLEGRGSEHGESDLRSVASSEGGESLPQFRQEATEKKPAVRRRAGKGHARDQRRRRRRRSQQPARHPRRLQPGGAGGNEGEARVRRRRARRRPPAGRGHQEVPRRGAARAVSSRVAAETGSTSAARCATA